MPYAYAAMRQCLRQAGEMTPDHPDYWRELLETLRRAGLSYSAIAREVGASRCAITRYRNRKDRPRDHVAAALLRLLVETVADSREWLGLGGK